MVIERVVRWIHLNVELGIILRLSGAHFCVDLTSRYIHIAQEEHNTNLEQIKEKLGKKATKTSEAR